jgi:dynein light chain roadblock-type
MIKHSGVVFEGNQGKKYAGVIEKIVDSVQTGLEEISGEQNEGVSLATPLQHVGSTKTPFSRVV